ncbi:MAG: nucleotidyltransferase substrate binding protein [Mariprofundaceae bacterium]|nr:nucleotidyltransferase substrate binding protein [Mariprofundaceae bacterium]
MSAIDLSPFCKALNSLQMGLERAEGDKADDMLRDSVIQRFEYTYELSWKMLKRRLQHDVASPEHLAAMSFRELMREGAERGLIADPQVWFLYRQKRNLTSFTYDADVAQDVYQAALRFAQDAQLLLDALQRRNAA